MIASAIHWSRSDESLPFGVGFLFFVSYTANVCVTKTN